jgi:hypothetical protein
MKISLAEAREREERATQSAVKAQVDAESYVRR